MDVLAEIEQRDGRVAALAFRVSYRIAEVSESAADDDAYARARMLILSSVARGLGEWGAYTAQERAEALRWFWYCGQLTWDERACLEMEQEDAAHAPR